MINSESGHNGPGGEIDQGAGKSIESENKTINVEAEIGPEKWDAILSDLKQLQEKAEGNSLHAAMYIKNLADLKTISPQKAEAFSISDTVAQRAISYMNQPHDNSELLHIAASFAQVLPERAGEISISAEKRKKILDVQPLVKYCREREDFATFMYRAANMKKYDPRMFDTFMAEAQLTDQDWQQMNLSVQKETTPEGIANTAAWLKIIDSEKFDPSILDSKAVEKMKDGLHDPDKKNVVFRHSMLEHGSNIATINS